MSDLNNILSESHEVELFGRKYELRFSLRNYAAIKRRFDKDPIEFINMLLSGEPGAVAIGLWAGTLQFEPFTIEDPIKIKEEISLEKLYELNFSDLSRVSLPLQLAIKASQSEKDEEIAGPEKK